MANRLLASLLAFALVLAVSGTAIIANRSGRAGPRPTAAGPGSTDPSVDGGGTQSGAPSPGDGPSVGATTPSSTGPGIRPSGTRTPVIPGEPPPPPCLPADSVKTAGGVNETGITKTTVRVGQIVSDSSNLPQQLGPLKAGLAAYAKLVNDAGGICGRTITVDYQNDNALPATHHFDTMAASDFAFVGSSSIIDTIDYEQDPSKTDSDGQRFYALNKDDRTGEYVPDLGGFAYSYGRSQSQWHAGVLGSISPTLVGGGQPGFYLKEQSKAGTPCNNVGVLYVVEPTGASQDQAELGAASLKKPWGGNLGESRVKVYQAALAQPENVYQQTVQQMIQDGVNCAFTYSDLGSNVNFVKALRDEGVWPPNRCSTPSTCFRLVWVPFSTYDRKFIDDAGDAAKDVTTFIPHIPLNETGNSALKIYLDALAALKAADPGNYGSVEPSTFSILGFASGIMFAGALQSCGSAPTRRCVMDKIRKTKTFSAGGLLGRVFAFTTTRATFTTNDGSQLYNYNHVDWKWIFADTISVRVLGSESDPMRRWHRVNPTGSGFFKDTLYVARGTEG